MLLTTLKNAAPRVVSANDVLQLCHIIDKPTVVELDADPARLGNAPGVAAKAVADVEHCRCPATRGRGPLLVRRPWPPVVAHQLRRAPGLATLQQQQPRGGVPQAAAHGKDVTCLRPGPAYRLTSLTLPQCRHRNHEDPVRR